MKPKPSPLTKSARTIAQSIGRLMSGLAATGLGVLLLAGGSQAQSQDAGRAVLLDFQGALGVATSEYLIGGIEDAEANGASLVIIRMDTPGGLVEPMRDIVQAILNSTIPVATYVSPEGARADSAGTYILLASHIAAMAPTTHLGAATPVSLTGDDADQPGGDFPGLTPPADSPAQSDDAEAGDAGDEGPDEDAQAQSEEETTPQSETTAPQPNSAMGRKVLNDAVAYIRGLAERHGRNADWAERAVRDAATLTAAEALEENVIDVIAANETELLEVIHGRSVKIGDDTVELDTEGLVIDVVEPDWRISFLSTIANPQIALLLLLVGMYGLLFEGYNPGAIVPGVVGVVCLLLAAYALQVIPVNFAGLALIVVGVILITAEAFVPSFGALGLGGIIAFIVGSIIMFDSGVPGFGISITFVVVFGLVAGLTLLWLVSYLVKLRQRGAVSGTEAAVGAIARAMEDFSGPGKVWYESEAWQAHSSVPVKKDQDVRILGVEGLTLIVKPATEGADSLATS